MKDRSHDDAMAELFKEDPAFAAEYLNQLLRDGEPADLVAAIRQIHGLLPDDEQLSRAKGGAAMRDIEKRDD